MMFLAHWVLPICASVAGFVAAWLWWKSAQIEAGPKGFEPVDRADSAHWWLGELLAVAQRSGSLNRKAAAWTAAATLLTTVANFTDRFF